MEKAQVERAPRPSDSEDGTAYEPTHVDSRRISYYDIHHVPTVDGPVMSQSDVQGKAICPFLMYSIVVIGASAFLYGYDNAIVSPVAALEPFVSTSESLVALTDSFRLRNIKESIQSQARLFSPPTINP